MAVDKLIDSTQLDAALTATANAIRAKTGGSVSLPWNLSTGFQTAVDEIPTGSTDVEDSIIDGTLSQYQNSRVTSIHACKFALCQSLVTVSFAACRRIGSSAFESCNNLLKVSFPSCSFIEYNAFHVCVSLTSVYFPNCVSIDDAAFSGCSRLTSVIFPSCERIASYAFAKCVSLQMDSFPALKSISGHAFMSCHRLISLYLLGSSIPRLAFSYAFQSTPIDGYSAVAGQYGSIYVPASMLSSYQTATNWVYFSARFVGLTDSEITALEETA